MPSSPRPCRRCRHWNLVANARPCWSRLSWRWGGSIASACLLPDPQLFLYAYVRREAVLSSQIEGTQSSLSDLLLFELDEAPGAPFDDVQSKSQTTSPRWSMAWRACAKAFPLCNRLLREMHAHLMARGRGSDKAPGEFRRSQNWIGGTRPGNARFVPPPPQEVEPCMAALESLYPRENTIPPRCCSGPPWPMCSLKPSTLFSTATARLGRLLIALLLTSRRTAGAAAALSEPVFQTAPPAVLRAARPGAHPRRLGSLGGFLPGRQCTKPPTAR